MGVFYSLFAYIKHYFSSKNAHGIHSPYVFDFYNHILHNPYTFYTFSTLEKQLELLCLNHKTIEIEDFGEGAKTKGRFYKKKISEIAKQSTSQLLVRKVLFQLADLHACNSILEIGTSLGFGSAYLAYSRPRATIISLEGAAEISKIAQENHQALNIKNIQILVGEFEKTLPKATENKDFDLVYFDGNHSKNATLAYFNHCLNHKHEKSIFVFDDIYWSAEMTEAWEIIKQNPEVTRSIDFYHAGIIYFDKNLQKEHFKLNY